MDPIIIPEELSELTDEQLVELADSIDGRMGELSESITPEGVEEIETLADGFERINVELSTREEAATALRERAEAARRRVRGAEATAEGEEAAEGEPEAEPEAEPAAPVAAAATRTRRTSTQLAERLNQRRSPAVTPEPVSAQPVAAMMTATELTPDMNRGAEMDLAAVANSIVKARSRMGTLPEGVHGDYVTLATANLPFEESNMLLGEDPEKNYTMLREVIEMTVLVASGQPIDSLVASGGPCAPFPPRYEIYRTARPHDPVAGALPTIGAPRGGIRWVAPPDFREARAGVGVVTPSEEIAGYGSGSGQATYKPCVHLDCPEVDETGVNAVSHCIEFGNLQFRAFPEWTQSRIADLLVEFTSVKEVLYLDVLDDVANSIPVTTSAADGYGVIRRVLNDARRIAANYRRRNGMDIDATLDYYLPSWLQDVMIADALNNAHDGLEWYNVAYAQLAAAWRTLNLNVTWYYDSATGEGQAFADIQTDGAANPYPDAAVGYLFSPGTFARLDGGNLDLGMVRDSVLNRTNDLQIFAEEWTNVVKLGIESLKVTMGDICPNGEAPELATAITCA